MIAALTRILLLFCCCLLCLGAGAQTLSARLSTAFKQFQADPQLRHALASLYVEEAGTGRVVFDHQSQVGLAPASTQKIITSITAYELLGPGFRYQTRFGYRPGPAGTDLIILPSGDPTLGSWRWAGTREGRVLRSLSQAIRKSGLRDLNRVYVDNTGWNDESLPGGWIWQDIGNYYGAGPAKWNWRENQYDVLLRSGSRLGDPVLIAGTVPRLHGYGLHPEATSAAAGTGDNAYIYFPRSGGPAIIRGTIPVNENRFKISGALPDPARQFAGQLADTLATLGIRMSGVPETGPVRDQHFTPLLTVTSPPLDSLVYWFNQKSINLYGEALLKTMAFQKSGNGTTDGGVALLREYWVQRGIDKASLNVVDGSGLSPLNRVTTQAQVRLLQHARQKPWFRGFYASLPEYNQMKMKSGTIRGVKGFCGYHTARDGKTYVFAFLVNNYNGPAGTLVQQMYRVLDVLK